MRHMDGIFTSTPMKTAIFNSSPFSLDALTFTPSLFGMFILKENFERTSETSKISQKNQLQFVLCFLMPFADCRFEHWKSDGLCDDINNKEECEYDGGDCCGGHNVNQYCLDCSCLGNIKTF